MTDQNSILDKLITSKHMEEATNFNPVEVIATLFQNLSSKERDILNRRFGLQGSEKETLEKIGQHYNITRERIRQIEVNTIKKLKNLDSFLDELKTAEHNVMRLLESHGGVMEENHLLEELLTYTDKTEMHKQAVLFILNNLLDSKLERVKLDSHVLSGWRLPEFNVDTLKDTLKEVETLIKDVNQLNKLNDLLELFKAREFFQNKKDEILRIAELSQEETDTDRVLSSFLTISKKIERNILDEWGLTKWTTVTPKRMGDKVYLTLRKAGKPLHFTEIAELINQSSFDSKVAYPATIHNELILDKRYILVGRGIYALKEWGYTEGTVIDVVTAVLEEASEPLSKEEIIKRVLDQRIVRKSTILLALNNRDKIKRLPNGTFTLA